MTDVPRYRLDELRRFAITLGVAVGLAPVRAAAFVSHLLWFDSVGAPSFGIASLPDWLDRMASGDADAGAEEVVVTETLGTASLDGKNGIPPLILARAGELAIEKARDAGTGLVRVSNIGPAGPGAPILAEMAMGPVVALILGPGAVFSMALPADEGLPAILDTALGLESGGSRPKRAGRVPKASPMDAWIPWASALVPERGWLVMAVGVKAFESLSTFQVRVGSQLKSLTESPGRLLPATWEALRHDALEHGVGVTESLTTRLNDWAARLGTLPLPPAAHSPPSALPKRGA